MVAYQAFYDLGIQSIRVLAKLVGLSGSLELGMDLFDICMTLAQGSLGCSEADVVALLSARLGTMHKNFNPCADELLELDEALTMLGQDAQYDIRQDHVHHTCAEESRKEFVNNFSERKTRIAQGPKSHVNVRYSPFWDQTETEFLRTLVSLR